MRFFRYLLKKKISSSLIFRLLLLCCANNRLFHFSFLRKSSSLGERNLWVVWALVEKRLKNIFQWISHQKADFSLIALKDWTKYWELQRDFKKISKTYFIRHKKVIRKTIAPQSTTSIVFFSLIKFIRKVPRIRC